MTSSRTLTVKNAETGSVSDWSNAASLGRSVTIRMTSSSILSKYARQGNLGTMDPNKNNQGNQMKLSAASYISSSGKSTGVDFQSTPRLQYQGGRHLIPQRLSSERHLMNTVTLKLMELNDENLSHLLQLAPQLLRLDLSGVHLIALPQELMAKFTMLRQLILDRNELTSDSFPKSFIKLNTQLIELSARFNRLTQRIPDSFLGLSNLQRLNLEGNDLNNIRGVEYLTKLRHLLVDNNNISSIPPGFYNLKYLEVFYISHNKLINISNHIKNMSSLIEINLSYNLLRTVPSGLFLLPRLEGVDLSHNLITNVPTLLFKGQPGKHIVDDIDLSENRLSIFPRSLPLICRHLDLTYNDIKVIPDQVLKRLRWHDDKSIQFQGNPMRDPSLDICLSGISAIVQDYHETRQSTLTYQGVKLLFMGATGCGKTSLIQTMMDSQTRLTEGPEECTKCFDIYNNSWEFGDTLAHRQSSEKNASAQVSSQKASSKVDMCLVDLSGDSFYDFVYSYVDQLPSFLILCVDLSSYSLDKFQESIGRFLDLCISHNNRVVCFLVGTKGDLLPQTSQKSVTKPAFDENQADNEDGMIEKSPTQQLLDSIHEQVSKYLQNRIDAMRMEMDKIEAQVTITVAMSEQLKQFIKLNSLRLLLYHEVVPCSCKQLSTVANLQNILCRFVVENESFEQVLRLIPPLWRDVEDFLEEESIENPFLSVDQYIDKIHDKFGLRQVAMKIGQYLHDTGRILWCESDSRLHQTIAAAPNVVLLCIKRLFHADVRQYLESERDEDEVQVRFMKMNFNNTTKWEFSIQRLCEWGILTQSLAKALWGDVLKEKQICDLLCYLCCDLQLGFPIRSRITTTLFPYIWSPLSYPQDEQEKNKDDSSSSSGRLKKKRPGKVSKKRQTHFKTTSNYSNRSDAEGGEPPSSSEESNEEEPEKKEEEKPPKTKDRQMFEKREKMPLVFFPSLTRISQCEDKSSSKLWSIATSQPHQYGLIKLSFTFYDNVLADLFQRIVVRLHDFDVAKLRYLSIWRNGFCFISTANENVHGRIVRQSHPGMGVMCIDVEMFHKEFIHPQSTIVNNDSVQGDDSKMEEVQDLTQSSDEEELHYSRMTMVWNSLILLLTNIEDLLTEWEGLYFRRFVFCPKCQHPSFLGEWLTPKETQSSTHALCRVCGEQVCTTFLVPPKERRKMEATKKLKDEMRERREQQQAEVKAKLESTRVLTATSQASTSRGESRGKQRSLQRNASQGSSTFRVSSPSHNNP